MLCTVHFRPASACARKSPPRGCTLKKQDKTRQGINLETNAAGCIGIQNTVFSVLKCVIFISLFGVCTTLPFLPSFLFYFFASASLSLSLSLRVHRVLSLCPHFITDIESHMTLSSFSFSLFPHIEKGREKPETKLTDDDQNAHLFFSLHPH